jgi:hypothetical protein
MVRANARSMRRSDPNPQATEMVSTLSSVSSNRRRARSVRTRSTKSAGLMFKPARNKRLSDRCETPASAARTSVRQSARGCAVTLSASFWILALPADCAANSAENWLLAPVSFGNSVLSQRACGTQHIGSSLDSKSTRKQMLTRPHGQRRTWRLRFTAGPACDMNLGTLLCVRRTFAKDRCRPLPVHLTALTNVPRAALGNS